VQRTSPHSLHGVYTPRRCSPALTLIGDRRQSFVELHSYDGRRASSDGTAGYLGNGYFITVKHGVVASSREGASDPRVINSVKLIIGGRPISARG
jgi:hypothetical protein